MLKLRGIRCNKNDLDQLLNTAEKHNSWFPKEEALDPEFLQKKKARVTKKPTKQTANKNKSKIGHFLQSALASGVFAAAAAAALELLG